MKATDTSFWKDFLNRVLDLFQQSVMISGMIALAMVFVACYLWVTGGEVPEPLFILLGTVVGFFFGAKTGTDTSRRKHNEQYAKLTEVVSASYTANPKVPQSGRPDDAFSQRQ